MHARDCGGPIAGEAISLCRWCHALHRQCHLPHGDPSFDLLVVVVVRLLHGDVLQVGSLGFDVEVGFVDVVAVV